MDLATITWIDFVLAALFVLVGWLAWAAHRRYSRLKHKYDLLQQRYEKAERQLTTLWAPKNT